MSSKSAIPIPWAIPPSVCTRARLGFTTVPQSTTARIINHLNHTGLLINLHLGNTCHKRRRRYRRRKCFARRKCLIVKHITRFPISFLVIDSPVFKLTTSAPLNSTSSTGHTELFRASLTDLADQSLTCPYAPPYGHVSCTRRIGAAVIR